MQFVFADQNYEPRIKGGYIFFRARVKDSSVNAISSLVDLLIALDKSTIEIHQEELAKDGVIIYDGEKLKDLGNGDRCR
jgi:2-oxoglutarate ferredoxin oxidoreductase subunit alpha